MLDELAQRYESILNRIAAACLRSERLPGDVTLVAVSKHKPAKSIEAVMRLGQTIFGENYVQEAEQKNEEILLDTDSAVTIPVFHLIGPLQRNKVKRAVGFFDLIQTVDREELATEIAKVATAKAVTQKVLIQVNISGESTKSGVAQEKLVSLAQHIQSLKGIELRGLMSIGTAWQDDTSEQLRRAEFIAMREYRAELERRLSMPFPELSMGMSEDFDLAIEEGATLIRVGTALFGERTEDLDV